MIHRKIRATWMHGSNLRTAVRSNGQRTPNDADRLIITIEFLRSNRDWLGDALFYIDPPVEVGTANQYTYAGGCTAPYPFTYLFKTFLFTLQLRLLSSIWWMLKEERTPI